MNKNESVLLQMLRGGGKVDLSGIDMSAGANTWNPHP